MSAPSPPTHENGLPSSPLSAPSTSSSSSSPLRLTKTTHHLTDLYSTLEQLVYIQTAALYYQDRLFLNLVLRWILSSNFIPGTSAVLHRLPVVVGTNVVIVLIHLFSATSSPDDAGDMSRGFVNGAVLIDFVGEFAGTSRFRLLAQDVLLLGLHVLMMAVGNMKKGVEAPKENTVQDLEAEERGVVRAEEEEAQEVEEGQVQHQEDGDIEMRSLLPEGSRAVVTAATTTTIQINVMRELRDIMRANQELQSRIRAGDEVALRTLLQAVATGRARQLGGAEPPAPIATTAA